MTDEREVFFCDCGADEHLLLVDHFYWDEESDAEFCIKPHLSKKPLSKRFSYAWRYLLGRQSRWGAFESIVLNEEDVRRLRHSCDRFLARIAGGRGEE